MTSTAEKRISAPGREALIPNNRCGNETNTPIVADNVPTVTDPASFLHGYTTGESVGESRGFIMGHREGFRAGFEDGYESAAEAFDAQFRDEQTATNHAVVESIVKRGPYADMAEKRGHSDRAARQRQILTEKGIS